MKARIPNTVPIVLDDGFSVNVVFNEYGDMELLEDLIELESGDAQQSVPAMLRIFKKLLPTGEKKRLWDHLRDQNGAVPIPKATDALREIFEKMQGTDADGKKKSSSSPE